MFMANYLIDFKVTLQPTRQETSFSGHDKTRRVHIRFINPVLSSLTGETAKQTNQINAYVWIVKWKENASPDAQEFSRHYDLNDTNMFKEAHNRLRDEDLHELAANFLKSPLDFFEYDHVIAHSGKLISRKDLLNEGDKKGELDPKQDAANFWLKRKEKDCPVRPPYYAHAALKPGYLTFVNNREMDGGTHEVRHQLMKGFGIHK